MGLALVKGVGAEQQRASCGTEAVVATGMWYTISLQVCILTVYMVVRE